MTILEIPNHQRSKFMEHYINNKPNMKQYFDYVNLDLNDLQDRYQELVGRSFPRKELSDYFTNFHQSLPSSEKVNENIKRILDPNSVVVVGGQQAGVLTGPLYSIHKCITIIKYAEECEKRLGKPVIPVFWIAGEDHDFDEVNHVFVPTEQGLKKVKYGKSLAKQSLSEMEFSKESVLDWSKELVQILGETSYTKDVYKLIQDAINNSNSFTKFFAYLIAELFNQYGLLLLDSGDHDLRKIEAPFFERIIENNEKIDQAFNAQSARLKEENYPEPIEVQNNNAHLFVNVRQERVLLYRNEDHAFVGKNKECFYNHEELLEISRKQPELLSNNVVTRPLMQELLLPTLTFVGGPGEIAYWSTLKGVFHLFDVKLPPLLPRLSFTLIEPKIEKIIKEKQLDLNYLLEKGVSSYKQQYLENLYDWKLEDVVSQVKESITTSHHSISKLATQVSKGLDGFASKNLAILLSQIDLLSMNIEKEIKTQNQIELQQYDLIDRSLLPFGAPQERTWNIIYYLNLYGFHFIEEIMEQNYAFDNTHKVYIF